MNGVTRWMGLALLSVDVSRGSDRACG